MKYIPAEKLIAEIERLQEKNNESENVYDFGTEHALKDVIAIITSLQQEQPETDFEEELRNYNVPFNTCGWERLTYNTLKEIAHHFWFKGYNAKKEESK